MSNIFQPPLGMPVEAFPGGVPVPSQISSRVNVASPDSFWVTRSPCAFPNVPFQTASDTMSHLHALFGRNGKDFVTATVKSAVMTTMSCVVVPATCCNAVLNSPGVATKCT
ncbi:MAG: hypothetical protein IPK85_03320 [Gemmatimonadetes bacterium]|nr:hypothetical protein [Gemmatimonadota bacterium]